jgi:hypothetical protein
MAAPPYVAVVFATQVPDEFTAGQFAATIWLPLLQLLFPPSAV